MYSKGRKRRFPFSSTRMRGCSVSSVISRVDIAKFCLEDAYESRLEGEETCVFDRHDLNSVYDLFHPLVYNQWETITGSQDETVFIRPYLLSLS